MCECCYVGSLISIVSRRCDWAATSRYLPSIQYSYHIVLEQSLYCSTSSAATSYPSAKEPFHRWGRFVLRLQRRSSSAVQGLLPYCNTIRAFVEMALQACDCFPESSHAAGLKLSLSIFCGGLLKACEAAAGRVLHYSQASDWIWPLLSATCTKHFSARRWRGSIFCMS